MKFTITTIPFISSHAISEVIINKVDESVSVNYINYENVLKLQEKQAEIFGRNIFRDFELDGPSIPIMKPLVGVAEEFRNDLRNRLDPISYPGYKRWQSVRNKQLSYDIKFEEGKVWAKKRLSREPFHPLNTEDGHNFIFIVDNDGGIVGTYSNAYKGIYHSSLLGNEWPLYAGEMVVDNGSIMSMTNEPGHFKPEVKRDKIINKILERGDVEFKVELIPRGSSVKRIKVDKISYDANPTLKVLREGSPFHC